MTHEPGEYIKAEKCATCKRCGCGELAWAKSARTGRAYLCATLPSASDDKRLGGLRYAAPWQPHKCGEAPVPNAHDAWLADVRASYRP